jgi:SPP1 gp7 family putative phage head morphogenesis protein
VARRSVNYWKRRAEARLVAIERGTEPYLKRIYQINQGVVGSIREDIERIIGSFAKHSQLTREEAISFLGETISEMERQRIIAMCSGIEDKATKARLMAKVNAPAYRARIDRLLAIEVSAQARMALLAPRQIDTMTAGLHKAGLEMYSRTMFDLQRGTGLGFSFAGVTDKQIESVMRQSWSGGHYSKRVWNNTRVVADRIRDTIEKNMITGKSWRRCLNAVEDQALIDSNYAASRIMRTETAYVANEMEALAYEEVGLEEYQYVATLDARTSTICQELDGKKFKLKDRETGKNYPPMHPHCRSTTVAVIDGFDMSELERRARDPNTGETYKVPANMTYREWEKSQADITQNVASEATTISVKSSRSFYRGMRDAYDKVLDHGNRTGNECLTWVDLQGNEAFPAMFGTRNKVVFTQHLIDFLNNASPDSLISIHNHPSSSSFSPEDLNVMSLFTSIRQMRVVGANGYKYYVSVGTGTRPSFYDIRQVYTQEVAALQNKYLKKINAGMSSAEAWQEHSHEAVKAVAKYFGWDYRRIRR